MSCCESREDPIGCCGEGCSHKDEFDAWVAQNVAADAEREMAEAAALHLYETIRLAKKGA
jgi:hypothetical protein